MQRPWSSILSLAAFLVLGPNLGRAQSAGAALDALAPVEGTEGLAAVSETGESLTLAECLRAAERHYPKVAEARARRDQKQAQVDVATFAPYSEFNVTSGLALAPTVRGTAEYSVDKDTSLGSSMALAWQAGVEGAVPLYTFGKLESARDAAKAQARLGEGEIKKEINDVRLLVHRAYYGARLATDALSLVKEAAQRVDESILTAKQAIAEEEGDDIALVRLELYRADLSARESELVQKRGTALAGLRFLTGLRGPLVLPREPLGPVEFALERLSRYQSLARTERPETSMAKAGVSARRALLRLEQSRLFPDLGLGLSAKWSHAPEVTDQTNPFVRDNLNYLYFVGGLVLKYKLDVLPQTARIDQARAQLTEVLATQRYVLGGIGQQVEEAYLEIQGTRERLLASQKMVALAKSWLVKVQQGIDVGTMEDGDIVEPAKEFALKRFAEMTAIFDFNMAVAKLSQTTGTLLVGEAK